MSGNLFIPKTFHVENSEVPPVQVATPKLDGTRLVIQKIMQWLLVGFACLLPLFFVPGLPASLNFDKVFLALVVSGVTIILVSLAALRLKTVTTVLPLPLLLFWGVFVVAVVSGLLSGDTQDAIRGRVFEPLTAGFIGVMALIMSMPLVLQKARVMSLRVLLGIGVAAVLVMVYSFLRVLFGGNFLAFGSFTDVTNSFIGGFNDLAILSALTIIISLITLLLLPLKRVLQVCLLSVVCLGLVILALVNFFYLWVAIGFFGLLLLVYVLSRNSLFPVAEEGESIVSPFLLAATVAVCLVSVLFIFAGEFVGTQLSALTGISYVEVRPSAQATIDVAQSVYQENILLGSGPNRFADMWSLYKDRSINETIFWSVDFTAGYSYMMTTFITLGVLGMTLLIAFQGWFLYIGYQMFLKNQTNDSYWNYFGVVSFVGATFLWIMSYLYVPNATILLITALFTGLTFVAYRSLVPQASITVPLVTSRGRGFALMTTAIIITVSAVGLLFSVGEQYAAQVAFARAQAAESVEQFDQELLTASLLYQDDTFANLRAQSRLAQMQEITQIENPTEEDQARFITLAEEAIILAQAAIALDSSNPDSHAVLAAIYATLAAAGLADAETRATSAYGDAIFRDPLSPAYALMKAYMAVQLNDFDRARREISDALTLKQNYTEALFLLTQLDIQAGNTDAAIATTRQIITLEPNNPTRYYQLGILLNADNDQAGAIAAFEAAVERDQNFANARYLLALTYAQNGRNEDALRELRIVEQTNPDNAELQSVIQQLETTGTITPPQQTFEPSVTEDAPAQTTDQAVVSEQAPDTNLITPVNTPPSTPSDASLAPVTQ